MTRKGRRLICGAGAAILLLAACGGDTDETQSLDTVAGTAAVSDTPSTAPEAVFVPTADGGQLDFNSLRGKDLLLWFWAPW